MGATATRPGRSRSAPHPRLRPEVLRQPIWKGWTCPCRAIPKAARPAPAVRWRGGACCEAAPAFAYRFRSIAPAEAPGNRPPPRASLRATDRRDGQADRHRPPPEAGSAPAARRVGKAEGQCGEPEEARVGEKG